MYFSAGRSSSSAVLAVYFYRRMRMLFAVSTSDLDGDCILLEAFEKPSSYNVTASVYCYCCILYSDHCQRKQTIGRGNIELYNCFYVCHANANATSACACTSAHAHPQTKELVNIKNKQKQIQPQNPCCCIFCNPWVFHSKA